MVSQISSAYAKSGPQMTFHRLKPTSKYLSAVRDIFSKKIAPVHGDQSENLQLAILQKDRTCQVLCVNENPVGILVYLHHLQNKFSSFHVQKSFEIRTMALISENSEKTEYLTHLIDRAKKSASWRRASGMHIIASPEEQELREFLKKKQFTIIHTFEDQNPYGQRTDEALFYCAINQKRKAAMPEEESKEETDSPSLHPSEENRRPLKRRRLHQVSPKKALMDPKCYRIFIKRQYFNQIQNGSKTVEGRIHSGQFVHYKQGEMIEFLCGTDTVKCRIQEVHRFQTFKEMLQHYGVNRCLADVNSLEDGVAAYHSIRTFPEREAKNGVIAFAIQREG